LLRRLVALSVGPDVVAGIHVRSSYFVTVSMPPSEQTSDRYDLTCPRKLEVSCDKHERERRKPAL
jgi:hypothetical protein